MALRNLPVAALTLALLIAGCVAPPESTPSGTADLTKPFTFSFTGSSCTESDVIFLVDQAKLQAQLPPGFKVADASTLGGAPVAPDTGKGAVLVNAFVCDETSLNETIVEGQLTILVDQPKMKVDGPEAALNFYEIARYSGNDSEARALDAIGWPHHHGEVKATMDRTGGTGEVTVEGAKTYSFSVTTPAAATLQGTARFWHVIGNGTAWIDYTFAQPVDQLIGTAQCEVAAGSHLANITGITTCTPDNSIGMGFGPLSPEVVIRYDPNVKSE